ncbi:hypothetical protein SLEP1_g26293 [Rubroshorea leprosula]|uniref:Uncharacterized protein n=1 Tax=Rubroshorea leprosula TaxID=152421 RepID=A0AAV5JX89_9ROSI|nr:hypothetical protein SLEP1_g26293 [Rubroshorea leprosula]
MNPRRCWVHRSNPTAPLGSSIEPSNVAGFLLGSIHEPSRCSWVRSMNPAGAAGLLKTVKRFAGKDNKGVTNKVGNGKAWLTILGFFNNASNFFCNNFHSLSFNLYFPFCYGSGFLYYRSGFCSFPISVILFS